MKNIFGIISLIFVFMVACFYKIDARFVSDIALDKVNESVVTIAVYYYMEEEEFRKRLLGLEMRAGDIKKDNIYPLQTVTIPIDQNQNKNLKILAYIGSGTLLRDNHIISVRHLFNKTDNIIDRKIWVFHTKTNQVVEADLIVVSEGKEFYDDYAVIKSKVDLKCAGVRIVKAGSTKKGDKIIFVGSPGGAASFIRFGHITTFEKFLKRDSDVGLVLSYYNEFPYWCVYPGGRGDSGGSILDIYGNLISVLYCGVELFNEDYVFANPTEMLWSFLEKNNLLWIGQRDFSKSSFEKIEEEVVLQR